MTRDYSTVTEIPDERITREAAAMLYSRYRFTRSLVAGRRILEVACGSGQGLGFLSRDASVVVGGDITAPLLRQASKTYGGAMPLVQLDAERLPFAEGSFDVVALHEAIYYLPNADNFVDEAYRVLDTGGVLLVVTINSEWADFNPSPFATRYYAAFELVALLRRRFEQVEVRYAFPANAAASGRAIVSFLKRAAVRFRLVPRTMRGKRVLKRLFLGPLERVPRQLTEDFAATHQPPRVLDSAEASADFKVLYAIGRRAGSV